MKVLVTGGAGFLGSYICERLLQEGNQVICLDNFDPYYDPDLKRYNIQQLMNNKGFILLESDIRDSQIVQETVQQNVDYIVHCAAQPGIRASVTNPLKTHEVNTTGTLNILQACISANVKRIINFSSSSVYGKTCYLPYDEHHPLTPISPYGVSKLMAEHYCRVFSENKGLRITTLRIFTAYGPRMRPDLAIYLFVRKSLTNETIEIFGDGQKTRDFTYVDDIVTACMSVMQQDCGEVYNIGSGNRISIDSLANKIINITGSSSKIIHTESVKADAEHTWANIQKASDELKWKPKVDLDKGLEHFIEWCRYRLNK